MTKDCHINGHLICGFSLVMMTVFLRALGSSRSCQSLPWMVWGNFLVPFRPGGIPSVSGPYCFRLSTMFGHRLGPISWAFLTLAFKTPKLKFSLFPGRGLLGAFLIWPRGGLEKAMAPYSSPLAWKIPWMEERGRLQSMVLQRVGHDWATSL